MARRISKPVSLYVAVILIVFGYGIIPFLPSIPVPGIGVLFAIAALPFNGSIEALRGNDSEAPFVLVFVTLFLCVFTVATAIWAFTGHKEGRIALLAFVSVNTLWWTFLILLAVAADSDDVPRTLKLLGTLIRPAVWIACIWVYFTNKDIVAYYTQDSAPS